MPVLAIKPLVCNFSSFGMPAFPVDTHIHRCAQRWGLTNGKNVQQTEKDLKKFFPEEDWNKLHIQIIMYARNFCAARACFSLECESARLAIRQEKENLYIKNLNELFRDTLNQPLNEYDAELGQFMEAEQTRQEEHIELIASENYASKRVLEAQGSVLTNKYAEGYPTKRYYGGCEFVDGAETLAIERAKKLFEAKYANVQPHSGASANAAVFLALLEPGDTILGMALDQGGHLTHGAKVNFSGRNYNAIQYGLDPETKKIDYGQVERLAQEHKPKMIIAGFSAYMGIVDWAKFRKIAMKWERTYW